MARKKVFGNCRICGTHTKLSFEHVPPRAAFNDHPAVGKQVFELINKNPDEYTAGKGHISQRGVGAYTLCSKCNNYTGRWYGDAFAKWAHQSLDILKHTKGYPSLYYRFHIYPLRVIKQIISMFFSINDDLFRDNHPDLVKFVLDKKERYLNPDLRILAYFNRSPRSRYASGTSLTKMRPDQVNLDTMEKLIHKMDRDFARSRLLSEIAFCPLGYLITFGSEIPDNYLTDISFFAKYCYDDKASVWLKLPVYPVYTWFPADYRSPEQVQRDFEENSRKGKEIQERKRSAETQ